MRMPVAAGVCAALLLVVAAGSLASQEPTCTKR
jgi:hypothetical protein